MDLPPLLEQALAEPRGAVFRRAALQVNPYPYLQRFREPEADSYEGAEDYNRQLVDALVGAEIEIIGVTDHDSVDDVGLRAVAEAAGILAFPGIELCAAESGVHVCVLFDPSCRDKELLHFEGWAGVQDGDVQRNCQRTIPEILEEVDARGGVAYFPHVHNDKGVLGGLQGQTRVQVWKDELTRAVAVPTPIRNLEQDIRNILTGGVAEYRRDNEVAVLHANDVSSPDAIDEYSWTWIKMSGSNVEGLRQAFLDPVSRVRRSDQEPVQASPQLRAAAWSGGFLDGVAVHLSGDLNVLVGGRGAGKSTIIESLRFALGLPTVGHDAERMQDDVLPRVLGDGGTVHVLLELPEPERRQYLVQRTIGGVGRVVDQAGDETARSPSDLLPHMELFGQHEIAEYAQDPEARLQLLGRFVRADLRDIEHSIDHASRTLASTRQQISKTQQSIDDLRRRLTKLEKDREDVEEYEHAGVEQRLAEKSRHDQDAARLDRAQQVVDELTEAVDELADELPLDVLFLEDDTIADRPAEGELRATRERLDELSGGLQGHFAALLDQLRSAAADLQQLRGPFDERRSQVEAEYTKARSQLGNEAAHYVALKERVAELPGLQERLTALEEELDRLTQERRAALAERGADLAALLEAWQRASRAANDRLSGVVRTSIHGSIDVRGVERVLRDELGGRLQEFFDGVEERAGRGASADDLVAAIHAGEDALVHLVGQAAATQAHRVVAELTDDGAARLEEVTPRLEVEVELNVGDPDAPEWRSLDQLSTGQRATAILLLALAESHAPLIIDQPEDDLDNAFIAEVVIPKLRDAKLSRQVVLSTHNANLPVLGDAEQIIVLEPHGTTWTTAPAQTEVRAVGAIDDQPVRQLVERLLEGGRSAFERRRRKYGF